jgi:hypothetical protein
VPGAQCPASESVSTFCDYDEGRCGCMPCTIDVDADAGREATGALMWVCEPWPKPETGCDIHDRLGGACNTPDKACGNRGICGDISTSTPRVCRDGHWVEDTSGIGLAMCFIQRCGW